MPCFTCLDMTIEDDEVEAMEAREDALVALLSTDRTIEPVVLTRLPRGIDEYDSGSAADIQALGWSLRYRAHVGLAREANCAVCQ